MPEVSIVLKAYDQITGPLKTISGSSQALSKQFEEQQRKLQQLGQRYTEFNKSSAEVSAKALTIKKSMDDAAKAFKKTGDEAEKLKFQQLKEEYKDLTDAAKAYDEAAADTRKSMRETQQEMRKLGEADSGGSAGGETGGMLSGLGSGLLKAGLIRDMGANLSALAGTLVESAVGQPMATAISGTLSGAASGAAAGAILGVPGMLAGGAIGAISGAINAGNQIFEQKDDAFKSHVQEATEGQISERDRSLAAGSAIAAGRETDKISFGTLFGSQDVADQYLSNLVGMSNETPFLYDDLTAMSKTLATYGYDADSILPVLQTVGDAGAALGQSTSDMNTVATAIGRMKSSDKASLEYLNMLNDRGIGAVGMLAEAKGVDQGTMYDMISKGQIAGGEAAEILLQAMADAFGGSMEQQSKTFSGLSSTVEGLNQELDNAMGEGFNETRKVGLEAQKDWLSGESGEAVKEANRAIGAWQAELENEKERYQREAVDAMMNSEEYKAVKEAGDAAEMGRMIMEAKIQGMNEYNASDGAKLALESELALARAVREDTKSDSAYYDAGLRKSQEFTRGLAEGMFQDNPLMNGGTYNPVTDTYEYPDGSSNAFGLKRVPYDGYHAVLHQDERILTAAEARERGNGGGVQVTFSGAITVRQDSDLDALAAKLADEIEGRALAYGG